MVPFEGPHKKRTEGARTKTAPLATAVSAKRAIRSKPDKSRKPLVASKSVDESQITEVVSEEPVLAEDTIRLSAYFKWVVAGRPEGDGVDFWLQAEQELRLGS